MMIVSGSRPPLWVYFVVRVRMVMSEVSGGWSGSGTQDITVPMTVFARMVSRMSGLCSASCFLNQVHSPFVVVKPCGLVLW